jgi:hypothetical protein
MLGNVHGGRCRLGRTTPSPETRPVASISLSPEYRAALINILASVGNLEAFTSRDVVINDVTLTSLKKPEWSQLVFCDDFVTILFWSLWWRHICSSVTKLVFPS